MSELFKEIAELVNIKHIPSTVYRSQTDGQTERTIGTIISIIRKLMKEGDEWEEKLPYVLMAYRTTVHQTTKETPFFLLYSRDAVLSNDMFLTKWKANNKNTETYSEEVCNRFQEARRRVREEVERNRKTMKDMIKE